MLLFKIKMPLMNVPNLEAPALVHVPILRGWSKVRESPFSILHAIFKYYLCYCRRRCCCCCCLFFQAHFNPQVRAFGSFLLCCILGLGQAYEAGYEDWSVEETQSWLRKIGLDRELGPGFELHEYDGRALQVSKTKTLARVSHATRSQYLTNPICRYLKHMISSSEQSFP